MTMAKGDYPTGRLVDVLREYKAGGGIDEVYEGAKQELKNLLVSVVRFERADELLAKVRDYHLGNPPYDFHRLPDSVRNNAAFDAWQEIFQEIKAYLASKQ